MEVSIHQNKTVEFSKFKALIMIVLSIGFMMTSAYVSQQFIADFNRFRLLEIEKTLFVIISAIGLPIFSLFFSQLLIEWRGFANGVRAVFYSSLAIVLAQAPLIMSIVEAEYR